MDERCLQDDLAIFFSSSLTAQNDKLAEMIASYGPKKNQRPNNHCEYRLQCQAGELGCRGAVTVEAMGRLPLKLTDIVNIQTCQAEPIET